jgi:hypothetical protein
MAQKGCCYIPMDNKILAQVEKMLENASVASVRSWLKGKGKKFSASTRQHMVARVAKLIEKSEITFAELEDGIVGIEEAGGKYILLHYFKEDRTPSYVSTQLSKLNITVQPNRELAKATPAKSTLAYANLQGDNVRLKWSETHSKPRMDFDQDKVIYDDVTKVIVLVANLKTKQVEIRYDRPEKFHPHSNAPGSKNAYFDYYQKLGETILGAKLVTSDLQNALKHLVDDKPSLVRLHRDGHKNKRNSSFSITAGKGADIREDEDFQTMHAKSGKTWAYEENSFYWRPEMSNNKLGREVFSHVDALSSSLRVDADCWDAEVDYAVQKIRELQ